MALMAGIDEDNERMRALLPVLSELGTWPAVDEARTLLERQCGRIVQAMTAMDREMEHMRTALAADALLGAMPAPTAPSDGA